MMAKPTIEIAPNLSPQSRRNLEASMKIYEEIKDLPPPPQRFVDKMLSQEEVLMATRVRQERKAELVAGENKCPAKTGN